MTRWRTSGPSWTICAKCGIDATIPDDVPRARFQRIRYPHAAGSVGEVDFQSVARAMGELHAAREIDQDSEGRYRLALVDSVHGLR